MNKGIKKVNFIDLLKLLEENKITVEQFYKLIDFENNLLPNIIKILKLEGIKEKDLLIEQLKTTQPIPLNYVHQILKKHPKILEDIEKRIFIIENSKNFHTNLLIAKLIEYDFIFKDKELLDIVLNAKRNPYSKFSLTEDLEKLIQNITENESLYLDGKKNDKLKDAFKLDVPKQRHYLIDMIPLCEQLKNETWYTYLIACCKENKLFDLESITNKLSRLIKHNREKEINQCLMVIDEREIELKYKLKTFEKFIENLTILDIKTIEDDNEFNYVLKHILKNNTDFRTYYEHMELFISKDSLCQKVPELKQAIFKINNIEIRNKLCNALTTNLSRFITVNFIKQQGKLELEEVDFNLEQLAIKNNVIDYLEEYVPEFQRDREHRLNDEIVEYIENNPKLEKEELLKLKETLQVAIIPKQEPIIYETITMEKEEIPSKGKIKKLCQKLFTRQD